MVSNSWVHLESTSHHCLTGIYTVLVVLSVFLQWRRRVHWVFQVLGLVMYVVATADVAYAVWLLFGKELKGDLLGPYMRVKYLLYVTNKCVFRLCGFTCSVSPVCLQTRYCCTDAPLSGITINAS